MASTNRKHGEPRAKSDETVAAQHGLAERFDYLAGDLKTVAFPEAYDIAILGHIVHSEGEAASRALFHRLNDLCIPADRSPSST